MDINKLKEELESPEGQRIIKDYFLKLEEKKAIENSQLDRFHEKYSDRFEEIVEKIINKYDSDEYVNREYKIGRQPTTPLFFFLLEYSEKYGRECTDKEWKEYGNSFSASLFFVKGYYFNLMIGQGSTVKIYKELIK